MLQGDPALPATDDHRVGLGGEAELLGLALAVLQPGLALAAGAVLHALGPPEALALLMVLELLQRGQQRPCPAVDEAEMTAAPAGLGLEADPRLGDALGARRLLGGAPAAGPGVRQRGLEHVRDAVASLDRPDVPREGDEVAPVALGGEQLRRGGGVAGLQRAVEALQPLGHLRGCGRTDGRGHRISPRYRWASSTEYHAGAAGRGPRVNSSAQTSDAEVTPASGAESVWASDASAGDGSLTATETSASTGAAPHAGGSTVSSSSTCAGVS